MVIEGGNALCPGETMVLKADLNPNDYVIQWTKDGMDLVGENGPTLTVNSKGLYGVKLDYKNVACYLEVDPIQVEYFDEIIIEKPPLNLVQCKSPTATTLFNLESSMKGVTHYPVTAMFYESKSDAENDTGQIPSYYNFDNSFSSKTIWVRIQSAISPCFKVYSFTIKTETCVIGLVPLNDMHICNTPGSTFDLSQYDSIVYHGAAGYSVEYFMSNTDAIARISPILSPLKEQYPGVHHQIIWVRVTKDSDPNVYAITSFELLRDVVPTVNNNITPLVACVDPLDPTAVFNLKDKDNEVKFSASGMLVAYFLNEADALSGDLSKSLPKTDYQGPATRVYARVYSAISGCSAVTSFELKLNNIPILQGPSEYVKCNDLGYESFDLGVIASEQKGINLSWSHEFYSSYRDATNGLNPIIAPGNIYTNLIPGGEFIYIRVEDEYGCSAIRLIDLKVGKRPATHAPSMYYVCDVNGSGITEFNLRSKESEIMKDLNASDYVIGYYTTIVLAQEGDPNKAIVDPESYSNLTTSEVYVRVESTLGCYSIEILKIGTRALPSITNPLTDFGVCDTRSNEGFGVFKLSDKKSSINGDTSMDITFHSSLDDAEAGLNSLNETSYSNTTAFSEVVYVRVTDPVTGCYTIGSFKLVVYSYPAFNVDKGSSMSVCTTSATGIGVFNLVEHAKLYIPSSNSFTFTFHETQDNAEKGAAPIKDPEAYSNVKVGKGSVFIRIVHNKTGCVGVYEIALVVNRAPIVSEKLPKLTLCDNFGDLYDGLGEFDLTVNESAILSLVTGSNPHAIEYYRSQADAASGKNKLQSVSKYHNLAITETIWVKLIDTVSGCSSIGKFELEVLIGLKLVRPTDMIKCSDLSLGQNKATFDLTTNENFIVGGTAVFGATYAYYESEADAKNGTNALGASGLKNYVNKSATQNIWIVVTNSVGCRATVVQTLVVYAMPEPNYSPVKLEVCEGATKDEGVFDLLQSVEDISQFDTTLDLYYYVNEADALGGDHKKALGSNHSATVTYTGKSGFIYVRVENGLSMTEPKCFVIVKLPVQVNPKPSIKALKPLLFCMEEPENYMEFDLRLKFSEILNGRNASDYTIKYYELEKDAQDDIRPISYDYKNITPLKQTIWVRLESKSSGCWTIAPLLLQIEPKVYAFDVTPEPYCDDNDEAGKELNDGSTRVDLTVFIPTIIGAVDDAANKFVTFYGSETDYLNNKAIDTPNAFVNTQSPHRIIAIVKNKDTKDDKFYCEARVEFDIIVHKRPEVLAIDGGYICTDLATGDVTPVVIDSKLDASLYDFIWMYNGAVITGATGPYYEASKAGTYTLSTVDKATGCESFNQTDAVVLAVSPFTIVIEESIGDRDNISSDGTQSILVRVEEPAGTYPAGVYEYALNDGRYQDSNVFYGVEAGDHLVWVRDKITGACAVSKVVSIMNYPKYFTPNGDGFNDTWNVLGVKSQPGAKIYIFDRAGKLLKQLSPLGDGWDGTYGGRPMPSTDYWFTIEYNDFSGNKREYKGHFSLKR